MPSQRPTLSLPDDKMPKGPSNPDAIVYMIQEPSVPKATGRMIDTTPLLWHGKVKVLLERNQNASYRPAESFQQIMNRLALFDPDRDFIAMAGGDTLGFSIATAALRELGFDHFYYLRFERTKLPDGTRDPASGSYFPVLVPLTEEAAERMMASK